MSGKNVWTTYQEQDITALTAMAEGYKAYISEGKTERECVNLARAEAEKRGFVRLEEKIEKGEALKPGDKVYADCMGKAMLLAVIGQEPMEKGMNILGAHIDSPRLDLKQNPLYEDTEMALLDTHYYGGIKKYQWVTLPLAIHGVVAKKDRTMISINIGEGENDPVFCISDLLVHLSAEQMEKKAKEVIEGEGLNVLIGSQPLAEEEKDGVKLQILKLLKDSYDMEEEDFLSAELEIVPAGKARDCGLDRSMVIGYGQDDRICAYTSLLAILEVEKFIQNGYLPSGRQRGDRKCWSNRYAFSFFEDTVAEIMNLTGAYSELALRRALRNSCMLSSDVSAAFDPNYASAFEKKNSAYFGKGLVFNKYTGSRGSPVPMMPVQNIWQKSAE